MKTLLLIRHAKSDWQSGAASDFERPLNDRGKRDAPMMAQRLLEKKIAIDAFVSSPARRARKTASLFCREYQRDKSAIIFFEELYAAPEEVFAGVVKQLRDEWSTVALFSHNPGITDYANTLTSVRIDNIPTCGIFAVRAEAESWLNFGLSEKDCWFVDYPRAGQD